MKDKVINVAKRIEEKVKDLNAVAIFSGRKYLHITRKTQQTG